MAKSKTDKASRKRNLDGKLALKHKISRLRRYIKTHPNDLEAPKALSKLEAKL